MTARRRDRLADQLRGEKDLLVVLAPGAPASSLPLGSFPPETEVHDLASPMPRRRERGAVILACRDLVGLRRAASALGNFGTAPRVGVWIQCRATALPTVATRPEWPPLDEVVASRAAETFVLLTFAAPAAVRPVLLEMARAAAPRHALPPAWPAVGARRDDPPSWPVADPGATVALPPRLFDRSVDAPPDLVMVEDSSEIPVAFTDAAHEVLGRAPVVSTSEAQISWEQLTALGPDEADTTLRRRGWVSLGAIDERMLNPMGFDRESTGAALPLERGAATTLVVADPDSGTKVVLDGDGGVSEVDVARLRRFPGLTLGWDGTPGPHAYCRIVAGLATSGIPLTCDEIPPWARHLLAQRLLDVLETPPDLTDRLAREEYSVRLRRAALSTHASGPWRHSLAARHGLQQTSGPRVSVLLVTRRPEMLPFVLRQAARQRGVDLEVVLATHGFTPEPAQLEAFREASEAPLTVVEAGAGELFGEVLNQAAERAGGDVLLKMDDDDWYGPDFISDLLLARGYSGADLVGTPAEFTFVEPLWLTTRRRDDTEVYRPFVAGGTMMIDRGVFRRLGGFRHTRKYVDANLLSAVTNAGGSVYRSHGLAYVLRRGNRGHTWDPGLGYFVTQKRAPEQWRGFHPSALLETAPADVPSRPVDERVGP